MCFYSMLIPAQVFVLLQIDLPGLLVEMSSYLLGH